MRGSGRSIAALCLLIGACTGSGAPADSVEVSGVLGSPDEEIDARRGTVVLVWEVASGEDHLYLFGQGEGSEGSYRVELEGAPPADALNDGLGVAFLLFLPAGHDTQEGILDEDGFEDLTRDALGTSGRLVLLYKEEGWTTPPGWELEWPAWFPDGYSCARGVPATEGGVFDVFEPLDCGAVDIRMGELDEIGFANWT